MQTWSPFTHALLRHWRAQQFGAGRMGFALSGGADSIALLQALATLQSVLKIELVILHIHHGGTSPFREKALVYSRRAAQRLGLPFHAERASSELQAEAEMRDFRRTHFRRWKDELGLQAVITAHHADDLLETRLLRLIRGTGPQGLLALRAVSGPWLRPALVFSRAELRQDLRRSQLKGLEDPSNRDTRYLRNWLREDFLKRLEIVRPGAGLRMGRSLELVVEAVTQGELQRIEAYQSSGIFLEGDRDGGRVSSRVSRVLYRAFSPSEQALFLAYWFRQLGLKNYSQNHVEETRKQLALEKSQHTFHMLGLEFFANAKQIEAILAPRRRSGVDS